MQDEIQSLQEKLINWFSLTKRKLPWRQTYDPYAVWISEIMLQQTQMERGVVYFNRWLERFPDVQSVAEASEQEILKLWEGLGYYARARNLHRAAKHIVNDHDGLLPCDPDLLKTLPGIGPYTAAAISSIACNTDIPVVDANVLRLFARLFDIDKPVKEAGTRKLIEELAWKILPKGHARRFNQALMDFGGLLCTPKTPQCIKCPVQEHCLAFRNGTVSERPVSVKRARTILIEMATGMLENEGLLFIQQRNNDDIWGGLWEFPGGTLETGETPEQAVVREYLEETGFSVSICRKLTTVTHFHTKYKVILHCFGCTLDGDNLKPELTAAQQYKWIVPEDLDQYGFPAGHRKLFEYLAKKSPKAFSDPCRGGADFA